MLLNFLVQSQINPITPPFLLNFNLVLNVTSFAAFDLIFSITVTLIRISLDSLLSNIVKREMDSSWNERSRVINIVFKFDSQPTLNKSV